MSLVFRELRYDITGLTYFTNYSVSISASNSRGRGPNSEEVFASLVTGELAMFLNTYIDGLYIVGGYYKHRHLYIHTHTHVHTHTHTHIAQSTCVQIYFDRCSCLFHPAPGALESVSYQPDILSVLISWNPPEKGRGYITMVTVEYYNSEGVKLGGESVNTGEMAYR